MQKDNDTDHAGHPKHVWPGMAKKDESDRRTTKNVEPLNASTCALGCHGLTVAGIDPRLQVAGRVLSNFFVGRRGLWLVSA